VVAGKNDAREASEERAREQLGTTQGDGPGIARTLPPELSKRSRT